MSNQRLDQLVDQVENYIECWKQFNNFVNLARGKKFSPEEDSQFLETKSVLVQELELILAAVEVPSPTREEIHALIAEAPSLRYLSDINEGALRNLESQWHRIYISWHAILGLLKARQRGESSKSALGNVFGKKKK
ncbi:MAG TPA: hypothetical protein P5205_10115 [Candidatus Paceibacterota bacterium]|nr:hypothetical protein [Verrucomicrobiota bacterium]HSA10710.1 hypothetical protein [Candidatus Paceibacterota bacterium]